MAACRPPIPPFDLCFLSLHWAREWLKEPPGRLSRSRSDERFLLVSVPVRATALAILFCCRALCFGQSHRESHRSRPETPPPPGAPQRSPAGAPRCGHVRRAPTHPWSRSALDRSTRTALWRGALGRVATHGGSHAGLGPPRKPRLCTRGGCGVSHAKGRASKADRSGGVASARGVALLVAQRADQISSIPIHRGDFAKYPDPPG